MKIAVWLSGFVLFCHLYAFCAGEANFFRDLRENQSPPPAGSFGIVDLRCRQLINPVGIDSKTPPLSWKLHSGEQEVKQVAYQVAVASSEAGLARPDLWNSGKIISDRNTLVSYRGKPLQSAHKYFWRVKVWTNKHGESAWSEVASFSTGILHEGEWDKAKWIAYERLPDSMKVFPGVHGNGDNLGDKAVKRAVIPCFRKGFNVGKKVKEAFVYAAGLGQYALYMNGEKMDSGFLNPAWSDYTRRCYYNAYDVTTRVRKGENMIGAIAGPGFFYINRERYRKLVIAAGYPMLRLKMVIRYMDGSADEIVTDETWKTTPSAITYSSIYGGEDMDANKIPEGWKSAGFDDRRWQRPLVVPGPGGKMQAQESYPLIIDSSFAPIKTDSSKAKYRMIDFGQNISGIIRLRASAPEGYTIRIIPAELIHDDNTPDQAASGRPYYWNYTFKGQGAEEWQPLFSYYGFRYAGIEVFDRQGNPADVNQASIHSITALHTQNGAPRVGSFRCSDTLFNRIFDLILWGIRNNMSNVATDCPHREKLGWLEETHLIGNSMQYNYDILRFYDKIIQDMKDAQLPDGMVPDIAPEYVVFAGGFRDSPEWGSAAVLVPWYTFQWYGDTAVLRDNYPMMKRYVEYLKGKAGAGHLLAYGLGDWFDLGPEQPGVSQLTPLGVTATAFYFYDARIVSKVAALLHENNEAERYASLADSIREAFNRKYYDSTLKVYATGSQTSFAIPLYFGLAPQKDSRDILANLADSIIKNNYALTAGDIGFRYVVQALEEGGYNDIIYKMNNRDDVPGYGYQLRHGATALTESWQALRNVSNNHMMLGHLMEWFYSGLGGIRQQPGTAGFKNIQIAPQFVPGIDWVDCSYQSINGGISVNWKRLQDGRVRLEVQIPPNTNAEVLLPDTTKNIGSGKYVFYSNQ